MVPSILTKQEDAQAVIAERPESTPEAADLANLCEIQPMACEYFVVDRALLGCRGCLDDTFCATITTNEMIGRTFEHESSDECIRYSYTPPAHQ